MNLNGEWEFGAGESARFDRRILVPPCPQSRLSGIGERAPGDVVWYRRRFAAPRSDRLLLHFVRDVRVRPDPDSGAVDVEVAAEGPVEIVASLGRTRVGWWSGPGGRCRIPLDRVLLWSPESPWLYGLEVRLLDEAGGEEDRIKTYFGLRAVEARDGRFYLNGRPYVQRLV